MQLRYQSWWAAAIFFLPWLSGILLCWSVFRDRPAAVTVIPIGFLVACHLQRTLHHHLTANHRPGEEGLLFSTLGAANWITVVRAGAVVALAGFLPSAMHSFHGLHPLLAWAPGIVYLGISIADLFDGIVARKLQRETELGKKLDIETDAAGLMTASLLAVLLDRLSAIYLLAGIAYYLFVFAIWVRQKHDKPVITLKQRADARIIAGFQMGLVGVSLLPIFNPAFTKIAGVVIMVPLLLGFFRDWLVVSGRLETTAGQHSFLDYWAGSIAMKYLPLLLRPVLFAGGIIIVSASSYQGPQQVWYLAHAFCCLLAGIGFMGRSAGLLLVLLIGSTQSPFGISFMSVSMFTSGAALMLTGSGSLSIWAPEEKILYRGRKNVPGTACDSS